MKTMILPPNANPIYGFLSLIQSRLPQGTTFQGKKILDCGAGGPIPPLTLFQQHGFESWGIDISESQLEKAKVFCQQNAIDLHLQKGDMRCIPFENETFDFVYEHFSMCHLSKQDTAIAIREMRRVLRPNGLCFLGVISTDCWPKPLFGEEREPGEYWGEEDGRSNVLHSMFDDQEASELVSEWEVITQEKQIRYLREVASQTSLEDWMEMRKEAVKRFSQSAWRMKYPNRGEVFRYVHLYFCLKKLREPLGEREVQVLRLLSLGLSNRDIADQLVVSLVTVKTHVHHIFEKLDAENRVDALNRAKELGLI